MKNEIQRVLELQSEFSHKSTPEMKERGVLVRSSIRDDLEKHATEIASAVGLAEDDLLIEGKDGQGNKTEVPWVRFASRERSPSATKDWYCVYLFDSVGQSCYLALAQGSSEWNGSDFDTRDHLELKSLADWARSALGPLTSRSDLVNSIELKATRSDLGPAYEAGTVVAVQYDRDNVPSEEALIEDVIYFGRLLKKIYQASAASPPPIGTPPEVIDATEAAALAAGRRPPPTAGQGNRPNAQQRSAIELHAMKLARDELVKMGCTHISDTSSNSPYDYRCEFKGSDLYVEVKGTTSAGKEVVVTRGEVEHHQSHYPQNALVIVSEIRLVGSDGMTAEGGVTHIETPWAISEDDLVVIAYRYTSPLAKDRR